MEGKTIDNKLIKVTTKTAAVILFFVVGVTNTANYLIFQQSKNTEQIEYNKAAEKRRNNHLKTEFDYKLEIHTLKQDLKDCKGK